MGVQFTKEELETSVRIPFKVESELKYNITELLNRCGIFHTIISRRKTATSLEHKFRSGKYGGEKKIQDIVGIRVILYYQDDITICRHLFDEAFGEGDWVTSENDDDSFTATKTNGVFRLPDYLIDQINPSAWDMSIDQTFEIQIRTAYFEGWHEVEHDLRYKYQDIWEGATYKKYSRQLNSIIATLELCDDSMITTLENFSHELYREERWDEMLRMHYRIRMTDQELYPELYEVFSADSKAYGKKLYKCSREKLILQLANIRRVIPISVNMVVAVLNDTVFHDGSETYMKVRDIMKKHNVFHDGAFESVRTPVEVVLSPLKEYPIFRNKVLVRGGEDIFEEISSVVYQWATSKYGSIFPGMEEAVSGCLYRQSGYMLEIAYDPKNRTMRMYSSHLANDVPCRTWDTTAIITPGEDEKSIWLEARNSIMDRDRVSEQERLSGFGIPSFYKRICSHQKYEIWDVAKYLSYAQTRFLVKNEKQAEDFSHLISSEKRNSPVVLVVSPCEENDPEKLNEEWIGNYTVFRLARTFSNYGHIYTGFYDAVQPVLERFFEKNESLLKAEGPIPALENVKTNHYFGCYLFRPSGEVTYYSPSFVENCTYNRNYGAQLGHNFSSVVSGQECFQFMLIDEIHRNMGIIWENNRSKHVKKTISLEQKPIVEE